MMIERIHLAQSVEDLYSGFNEVNPILDTRGLQYDTGFQTAIQSSYGRKTALQSSYRKNSFNRSSHFSRAHTSRNSLTEQPTRPMTAVRGAGYRAPSNPSFDPPHAAKSVNLLEDSVLAASRGEMELALEKAKEAVNKERSGESDDITFAVLFNLAIQYGNNEMYSDAINTYNALIKNRAFTNTGRLKLNIGKIYYLQGNYLKAIKFFRMALDQVPTAQKYTRMKIMRNIGLTFVRMNQYMDAITSFQYILSSSSNHTDPLHLLLCNYALGDRENMKKTFLQLLQVSLADLSESKSKDHSILMGAKLISPVIGESFTGYDWCVEAMRSAGLNDLANDLEINKAVKLLKSRQFNQAIQCLQTFEKKEGKAASSAATNLSFLYLLQNEIQTAAKYADSAISADRYNSGALINKGNCQYLLGDWEAAKSYYKEALINEPYRVEALYNLALAHKKCAQFEDALDYLLKMNSIIPNQVNVIYQIANIYEQLNYTDQAIDWFQQLLTFVPSDPAILNRMSDLFLAESDKHMAISYLNDSYRYFPSHIPTIERMAVHYIETQIYEKAIKYLERATIVQPNQVKWYLMIAACYRRSGNYQQAVHYYKTIHSKFPENIECVKLLVRICHDLNLPELNEYSEILKRLEKSREARERRTLSAKRSSSRSNRRSAESNRGDSASSNSSGYMTSTSASSKSSKRKPILDTIDIEDVRQHNERPTTSWKRRDDDDFINEDIVDILPE